MKRNEYTVNEAAEMIGVTPGAIWRWIRNGKIKAHFVWIAARNRPGPPEVWIVNRSEIDRIKKERGIK